MHWYNDNFERLRLLSKPFFVLYTAAKAIGGIGIGVLLANWLDASIWWIFIVVAVLLAIPVIIKVIQITNSENL